MVTKAGIGQQEAQLMTEFGQLNKLKQQAKTDSPEALRQVAQQFEQMFLNMLMKSMRDANESFGKDNFMNSSQTRFYQDMLDSQMTMDMAQNSGVGLSEVLVRQLSRQLDIRMDTERAEGDKRDLKPLNESERMLVRSFDSAAGKAASAMLAQHGIQVVEQPPHVTAVEAPEETKPGASVTAPESTSTAVKLPERFDSPEQFVQSLMPIAEKVAKELGVDPKILLAQSALETGWGKYVIRSGDDSSHNLFNIKADSRWDGDRAQVSTLEYRNGVAQKEQAYFRSYESYEESFRDYMNFLKGNSRYQQALESAADPQQYIEKLHQAGYATDPEYARKITDIFNGEVLAQAASSTKES